MSFDVFFQRYRNGEVIEAGGTAMREVLQPHVAREEPKFEFLLVEYGDGSADIYLSEGSMMANHIAGEDPWDLLVEGARAADWVITPVGRRTCIIDESQRPHLPADLAEEAVLVSSGNGLLDAIQSG